MKLEALARLSLLLLLSWHRVLPGAEAIQSPPSSTRIPVEDLFRPPPFRKVRLSPNGTHLAAIMTDAKDATHLVIYRLSDGSRKSLLANEELDVFSVRWLDDDSLAVQVLRAKIYSNALLIVSREDPANHVIVNRYDAYEIVGYQRSRPNRLLIWIHEGHDRRGLLELDTRYSVGDRRGASPIRYDPPDKSTVVSWGTDFDEALAFVTTFSAGRLHLHRYQPADRSWHELPIDPLQLFPLEIDPDGKNLWVIDPVGKRLRRYRLEDGALDEPVDVHVESLSDEPKLFFSRRTRQLAGITQDDLQKNRWLMPEYAHAQQAIDAAYPANFNRLVEADDSDRHFLFKSSSAQEPGKHVLFDAETEKLVTVSEAAPWLRGYALQASQSFAYSSRDGTPLGGRLTLPPGAPPDRGWPLLTLPRDFPWQADAIDFQPIVQFAVSRGVAVFQPNYRGFIGGAPGLNTDDMFNFQRMHEDVTDGTRALIASGKIDPRRIAIMGSRFGGSLAISGVALEPQLYRCAIGIGGIYDWEEFLKDKRSGFGANKDAYTVLGDILGKPGTDHERLQQISTLAHANKIQVPVLLAHGRQDFGISLSQSKKLAAVLKRNRIPYETYFRWNETNEFFQFKSRVDLYKTVENFLATYLATETPPPK